MGEGGATRVLAIDDEPTVRALLAEMLRRAGYEVLTAGNGDEGLLVLDRVEVAAVITDVVMPGLSGLDLVEQVHLRRPSVPVVLVTAAGTSGTLADALARGAQGFVAKPFTIGELEDALARALRRVTLAEEDLRQRLLAPTVATVLANAVEARQADLTGHCERLSALARRIGRARGLDDEQLELLAVGATLHDVGKIGIPDRILLHGGPLDHDDLDVMRTHPLIGDRLLEPFDLLADIRPIVRHHHERWDGTGYPDGLPGEEIPLAARIVALADAVEAMSSSRVYRSARSLEAITTELGRGRGQQWDPDLVDIVLGLIERAELRFGPDGLELHELALGRLPA